MRINSMLETFETAVDPAAAEAGGDPSPEPVAAGDTVPAGTPSLETTPPAPAADPLNGLDPQDLAELAELLPILRQAARGDYQEPQQPQQQPQGAPEFDPFDPESFAARLEWERNQTLSEIRNIISPLTEAHQTAELTEAEQRAQDILRDEASRNGDYVGGDESLKLARQIADQYLPQYMERYGQGPRAAEAALSAAAQHVRQLEQSIGNAAVERYKNQMSNLSQAGSEPGVASAAPPVNGEYRDEMDVFNAWNNR